jgi:D-arabinono-1,4-lactone oxidase
MDPKLSVELSKLDPDIPFRSSTCHLHHTWAKTFYSRPELYIQPESVAEIQKAVTLARRCRRRLVVVGYGHSPSDLTCTSSWQMNLGRFNRLLSANRESGVVTFESGISLHDLGVELGKIGLSPPNLGSIDNQSIAGAISTGTHGSSLKHGLLSQSISSLSLVLANGHVVRCSASSSPSLFRAALLSLGAIGVITEITFTAVSDFNIYWEQSLHPLSEALETWDTALWDSAEYSRVWWLPYLKRTVFWRATRSEEPLRPPKKTYYGRKLGFHIYHNLLFVAQYVPQILPWVEWFIFGMQYGFKPGKVTATAVQPAREGLLMDCLYSQFVNEWALPLEKGPEAIERLSGWINGDDVTARIPVSSKGVWVHSPIEVRVSDTATSRNASGLRPFLDPTCAQGPTLYLNATLYRPYGRDPPCRRKYYEAFEWLMRDLGGRPHWAKNFTENASREIPKMYGEDMTAWASIRNEYDPDEMFIGEWHRRNLPLSQPAESSMAEREKERRPTGQGDAVEWVGQSVAPTQAIAAAEKESSRASSPSPPITATSEESFDYLAKGEASMYMSRAGQQEPSSSSPT